MAKRRDRYEITGNMSANGKDLKGVILVDLGVCGYKGNTTVNGKKLPKGDLRYRKFKFEDPKVGRALGLPKELMEYIMLPEHVSVFLTKQSEENTK